MVARDYHIILASNSPRRKELLAGIDVNFDVRVIRDIDESYPASLPTKDIAEYISRKKATVYRQQMASDELIITADTIVVLDSEVMGKPHDEADASRMLHELSGRTHQVITGVTLTTIDRQRSFSVETDVTFKSLTDEEINYYIQHYKPYDKAGAYGIQEWIGHIGVTALKGSYFNVMGLPVQRIYEALRQF
ncbi:septum formation protein [Prevotella sp. tc2-28]|jgi:septum formation protein|uniref:Maf-like protein n=1 Tax=Prevotella sp. tc2-28 TaxID=1761888 RepID=UPI000899C9B7|nr:Maf-like protein [Prevotella sp. tc2-28]SEA20659.1 septum formation protein [Prevotella sp. tc2-28]